MLAARGLIVRGMLQLRVGRFISSDRAGGDAAAWWHRDAPAERHSRTTAGAGTAQSVKRIARRSHTSRLPTARLQNGTVTRPLS